MMSLTTATAICHSYRRGGFAERVSRMGDDEFEKYETALRTRFELWQVGTLELAGNCLRTGLLFSAIIFVGYCLLFVLFFQKPVMVGLVASLVLGLLSAIGFFILGINYRMEKKYFRDAQVDDLSDTRLAGALQHADRAYEGDADLTKVAVDIVRWLEYVERRHGEVAVLADAVYADDEKTRERLHTVADMECLAMRQNAVKAFAGLDRCANNAEETAPSFDWSERQRISLRLTRSHVPIHDLIDSSLFENLDYTRLVLEMESRGIPVRCKEGDEGYDEAKGIADGIYGELLEAATDSVLYAFPSDFDMLAHLEFWDASDRESDEAGEETGE